MNNLKGKMWKGIITTALFFLLVTTGMGRLNPSAVYCKSLGYEYVKPIEKEGICRFPDGSSCAAWDFLQGKCGRKYSYCEEKGS